MVERFRNALEAHGAQRGGIREAHAFRIAQKAGRRDSGAVLLTTRCGHQPHERTAGRNTPSSKERSKNEQRLSKLDERSFDGHSGTSGRIGARLPPRERATSWPRPPHAREHDCDNDQAKHANEKFAGSHWLSLSSTPSRSSQPATTPVCRATWPPEYLDSPRAFAGLLGGWRPSAHPS